MNEGKYKIVLDLINGGRSLAINDFDSRRRITLYSFKDRCFDESAVIEAIEGYLLLCKQYPEVIVTDHSMAFQERFVSFLKLRGIESEKINHRNPIFIKL